MGKRSGVAHTDAELVQLTIKELQSELARSQTRLCISTSAKTTKQWQKRIRWLQMAIAARA